MTIIYNYTLLYRKNTYIVIRIFIGNNIILYKCEYIYACIIPPFASSLHAWRCCVWRNMTKLPRSKASLHSRAAWEIGRTFFMGIANNTLYILRMLHTFRAAIRK